MRRAIPWSTRRFFASNSAKMQDWHAKRKQLKEKLDQQAPLNTMEALKNAFSTQEPSSDSDKESNTGTDMVSESNS